MNKGTHFNGQPMYGQLISLLDRHEILKFSHEKKGERDEAEVVPCADCRAASAGLLGLAGLGRALHPGAVGGDG